MAYTVRHQRRDGSIVTERRGVSRLESTPCEPVTGQSAAERKRDIEEDLKNTRRNLRKRNGMCEGGTSRLVAKIPPEVVRHVFRTEGREAASDVRYLIKASQKLGIDPRVSRGRF